jgi:hypothetical protein
LNQSEDVKITIQRDAAECLMQLALFEPGRDYMRQETAVLDAVRMLVDKAFSEEAKHFAEGALMALLPPEEKPSATHGLNSDALHVMLS